MVDLATFTSFAAFLMLMTVAVAALHERWATKGSEGKAAWAEMFRPAGEVRVLVSSAQDRVAYLESQLADEADEEACAGLQERLADARKQLAASQQLLAAVPPGPEQRD